MLKLRALPATNKLAEGEEGGNVRVRTLVGARAMALAEAQTSMTFFLYCSFDF